MCALLRALHSVVTFLLPEAAKKAMEYARWVRFPTCLRPMRRKASREGDMGMALGSAALKTAAAAGKEAPMSVLAVLLVLGLSLGLWVT